MLPTVVLKTLFGEFAARPEPGRPGYLDLDPVDGGPDRDRTPAGAGRRLPPLGDALGSAAPFESSSTVIFGALIETYDGRFAPRFISRDLGDAVPPLVGRRGGPEHRGNYYGVPPDQDSRLVAVMERWGFAWGGRFIVPDGTSSTTALQRRRLLSDARSANPRAMAAVDLSGDGRSARRGGDRAASGPPGASVPVGARAKVGANEASDPTTDADGAIAAPEAPEPAAPQPPPYFLAWTSGLPLDFRAQVRTAHGLEATVVVAGDTRWMTRSLDAGGAVIDRPRPPFAPRSTRSR